MQMAAILVAFALQPTGSAEVRVEVLLGRLSDPDPRIRGAASLELRGIDADAAVAPLTAALTDADEVAIPHILTALANFHDARKVPALIGIMRRFRYRYWDETSRQITRVGTAALPALFEVADACRSTWAESMNQWAAHTIAAMGQPARAPLEEALQSASSCRRLAAVYGLAMLAQSELDSMDRAQALLSAAARDDGDARVREAATRSVDDIKELQDRLDSFVSEYETYRDDEETRALLLALESDEPETRIEALQQIGYEPDASLTSRVTRLLVDEEEAVRVAAVEALESTNARPTHHNDERDRDPAGSVPALTRALGDSSAAVRRDAAHAIGSIAPPGTELSHAASSALVELLNDPEESVIAAAAEALGRLRESSATSRLMAALEHPASVVRRQAATALIYLDDPSAAEALAKAMRDPDDGVRRAAASTLRSLFSNRPLPNAILPELIAALDDPSTRPYVIDPLGASRDPRAVEPLLALLSISGSPRCNVCAALGEIGDPRSVEPMITHLGSPDPAIRLGIAHALGRLGDLRAVEPLINVLGDKEPGVRVQACHALGALGDPRAVDALIGSLKDEDDTVRNEAAKSLGRLGDSRSVQPLIDVLPFAVAGASEALGRLGDERAVEPLLAVLETDVFRRTLTADALGAIGDPRAIPALIEALDDDTSTSERYSVQAAAARALAAIGDPSALPALRDKLQRVVASRSGPRREVSEAITVLETLR